ncbi:MAG TPA: hypothetical protein VGC67_05200 [Cellulomonas sp.]
MPVPPATRPTDLNPPADRPARPGRSGRPVPPAWLGRPRTLLLGRGARARALLVRGAVLLVPVVLLAVCADGGAGRPPTEGSAAAGGSVAAVPVVLRSEVTTPADAVTVVPDGSAVDLALATSAALFAHAPAVVLTGSDADDLATASSTAVALGVPVLPVPDADPGAAAPLADELDRLGATELVVVGADAAAAVGPDLTAGRTVQQILAERDRDDLTDLGLDVGDPQPVTAAELLASVAALDRPGTALLTVAGAGSGTGAGPDGGPPASASPTATAHPSTGSTVAGTALALVEPSETTATATAVLVATQAPAADVADGSPALSTAAAATARAAGVPVVEVPGGDPRGSASAVQALTGVRTVLALGSAFGSTEVLAPRLAAAATGVQLPGGGQLVFPDPATGAPGRLYVALYGTPGTPALGVLGEQDVAATISRAEQTADQYRDLTDRTVVPTLEIIATIASANPEADGSYSRPRTVDELRPLVEAADAAGMAVVLDLQPGRTDFLTQAQQYAELLAYPNVGLALDPEWRLGPDQVHLRQIGSVGVDEVNVVGNWLATFTRDRALPQKLFVLHQFSLRMITDRDRLDVDHDELAVLIHADGQGTQPAKTGTWDALRQGAPAVHWGWKNFYDEDEPMLDPAQTMQVQPTPDLVTYQ